MIPAQDKRATEEECAVVEKRGRVKKEEKGAVDWRSRKKENVQMETVRVPSPHQKGRGLDGDVGSRNTLVSNAANWTEQRVSSYHSAMCEL